MKHISAETSARISRRIRDDIAHNRLSGASAAVWQAGEQQTVILGAADTETGAPLREDTVFRMASMSKPITAVAVMRQAEKGLLDPEDNLSDYLPQFREMRVGRVAADGRVEDAGPAKHPITIAQLMNHTSGVLSGETACQYGRIPEEYRRDLERITEYYGNLFLDFDPGTSSMYSGVGAFDILSRLVEITSGLDFNTYLRQEICDPLGMTDTTFTPDEAQKRRLCTMHDRTADGRSVNDHRIAHLFEDIPATCFSGGAGLCSTLPDYLRFARMLLGGGTLEGVTVLRPETLERMVTVPDPIPNRALSQVFGLGMRVIIGENRLPLRSFGWSGAYGTHFFIDRENALCAVYLKNSRYDGGSEALTAAHFEEDVEDSLTD